VSMDRVILVHALEHAEPLRPFLREIWRVLAGGGRLIVIVPNRRGIWARFERTPFGLGQPYSAGQLSRLLRDNLFTPLATRTALFVPPFGGRLFLSSAMAWERIGERWFDRVAGVVMIEASKQLYAPTAVRVPSKAEARRQRAQPAIGHPAG
jgi:SAM-dependent methyltransferase